MISSKTVTTTVKLPININRKIEEKVLADGYGWRGKNRWVKDAIEYFLTIPNYPELVDIANDIESCDELLSLRLPFELINKIDTTVIEIRKQYPSMEGVRSSIIRASILQGLIRLKPTQKPG